MTRGKRMLARLPALYRPERDADDFLSLFFNSVGNLLEEANRETSGVLRAHWLKYADNPAFDEYSNIRRDPQGASPHANDLKRLASLVSMPLREEPVEVYRARIEQTVKLYRNGLGTLDAIRNMVEAHLPPDRPFWLEESAPYIKNIIPARTRYEPEGVVGPLMDWDITNEGDRAVSPTIYIQGMQSHEGLVDPAQNPLIELCQSDEGPHRVGIAYRGTVAPDQTLRLRPAFASWIGPDDGIKRSWSSSTETAPADPNAPGPWQDVAEAPKGVVAAIHYAEDRSLWVATNNGGAGSLWRYDGKDWAIALDNLPALHCLAEDDQHLLVGKSDGLLRMSLYPVGNEGYSAEPIPALEGSQVYEIFKTRDGHLWAGTDNGAALLTSTTESEVLYDLTLSELQGTEVYAISQDRTGVIHFGTRLGLFQYHPHSRKWYWYSGEGRGGQSSDWREFDSGTLPSDDEAFLPPVRCVYRGPDASLWIGTDHGIARYVATSVGDLRCETALEAFPDIANGKVFAITEDERGLMWFCTDRGLFKYDGRDFWQFQRDQWAHLGRADKLVGDASESQSRGRWRYKRVSSNWQRWDEISSQWRDFSPAFRSTDEPAVRTVAWTDHVVADIGRWYGDEFISHEQAPSTKLVMRYKPDERRIVNGGIPSIPRLPVGTSVWRYLSLEPENTPVSGEHLSWSAEGRLLYEQDNCDVNTLRSDSFDRAVFPFNPAARVWFSWEPRQPLSVLVRMKKRSLDEHIDTEILDRVWQAVQQARPAGVRTMLAVEEEIVRGGENGPTG